MSIGPITNPETPKRIIPPSVENKIRRGCICVSFPTSGGRRTLSILLIIIAPISKIARPAPILPKAIIIIPAGNQTMNEPTAGIIENMVIMTPQRKAPSTPVK